ncbi:MAG: sigma-70 family RNA polymerase sigma factor [Phycisphaerales bacterium]|nr:sigma-70 family RNA polymerase sigma factor [Phycisphaerales bacterium]
MIPEPNEKENEWVLSPELLEYARAVALQAAQKYCPEHVDYDDVVQETIVRLLRKPPKYDPTQGASEKTFIYKVVQRAVMKVTEQEAKQARRFQQFPEPMDGKEPVEHLVTKNRSKELTRSRWSLDDILEYISDEESKVLCRLVIECKGNLSETARRLGMSEGSVRRELRLLAPGLLRAGFDPFSTGGNR